MSGDSTRPSSGAIPGVKVAGDTSVVRDHSHVRVFSVTLRVPLIILANT